MKTNTSSPRALRRVSIVIAAGLLSSVGFAQVPTEPQLPPSAGSSADSSMNQVSRSDRRFLQKTGEAGLKEVAISQIAVTRATHPQVRSFAEMMVADHNQVNAQLAALAARKGVDVPMDRIDADKWQKKDAEDFDEDYVELMISAHKDSVERFEKAAKKADDAEIRTWAAKVLPALQAHLEKVKALESLAKM